MDQIHGVEIPCAYRDHKSWSLQGHRCRRSRRLLVKHGNIYDMTKHKPKRESVEADGCSIMFAGPEATSRHTATHLRRRVALQPSASQPAATPTVHMRLPVYGSRQAKMEQGIGMKSHIQPRRRHVDSIAFGEKATRYPIKIHFQDQSKHFPITKIISKHHPRPDQNICHLLHSHAAISFTSTSTLL